jgi:hypothetical protein
VEFHGEDRQQHDARRRTWMERHRGWVVVVARRQNLFGRAQDVHLLLREGHRAALQRRFLTDPPEAHLK